MGIVPQKTAGFLAYRFWYTLDPMVWRGEPQEEVLRADHRRRSLGWKGHFLDSRIANNRSVSLQNIRCVASFIRLAKEVSSGAGAYRLAADSAPTSCRHLSGPGTSSQPP